MESDLSFADILWDKIPKLHRHFARGESEIRLVLSFMRQVRKTLESSAASMEKHAQVFKREIQQQSEKDSTLKSALIQLADSVAQAGASFEEQSLVLQRDAVEPLESYEQLHYRSKTSSR